MEIEDKTDQPRSLEELEEAKKVVEKFIIKQSFTEPPPISLLINLPTIRDALKEAIERRSDSAAKVPKVDTGSIKDVPLVE